MMRKSGRIAARLHTHLRPFIKPGITTQELNEIAERFIKKENAVPAFKGYGNFPAAICTSVNEELVHCKPSSRVLKDGDILTVDLGVVIDGFYSDTAKTYFVGNVSDDVKAFVLHGYLALLDGIEKAKSGNHVGDISNAVSSQILKHGYGIVEQFVGHGIGKSLHEEPQIGNTPAKKPGPELTPGMVICIEPILTMGSPKVKMRDNWDVVTEDGSIGCHWEHQVAITEDGPEILTQRDDEGEI